MAECIVIRKYNKPLDKYPIDEIISYFSENILQSGSFTVIGSKGNYNFGDTNFTWTASKDCIAFISWAGLSSNYSGSISITTDKGFQIGTRQYRNPDYLPNHWGAAAFVKAGGVLTVKGNASSDEHFSVVGFAILLN